MSIVYIVIAISCLYLILLSLFFSEKTIKDEEMRKENEWNKRVEKLIDNNLVISIDDLEKNKEKIKKIVRCNFGFGSEYWVIFEDTQTNSNEYVIEKGLLIYEKDKRIDTVFFKKKFHITPHILSVDVQLAPRKYRK